MDSALSLRQIAKDLNVSLRTVQRLIKSGQLQALSTVISGARTNVVPLHVYLSWKQEIAKTKKENEVLADFDLLKEKQNDWVEWCRNGALIGRPMSEDTIIKNNYFLNYYWKLIPRHCKASLVSVACLRHVLGNIDPKKFSLKEKIYKSVRSFTKYLLLNGYCASSLFDELKQLRPKRFYPPKKIHCTQEQFERLLATASIRVNGQSNYDVLLNGATIATIGLTGLRASELCNLRLQDVDLINKKIFVYLGKGKKNRVVGICNRLYEYLSEYLKVRLKTDLDNFFISISNVTSEPVPIQKSVLLHKVKRLSKRLGFDVNLHGLRRTFATIAANSGKPINIISLALGHADLKTTQGYLMTSQEEVIKEMQNW